MWRGFSDCEALAPPLDLSNAYFGMQCGIDRPDDEISVLWQGYRHLRSEAAPEA